MPIEEIKKVCFIGAGTMGCFNSLATAIFGYPCVVYDISEEALKRAPGRQREFGAMVVAQGKLTQEVLDAGLARIAFTSDIREALRGADLVSESVIEKLSLKREVHRQLDEICEPQTILTTNTSYLLVSEIEDVVKRGDRFAALHFHLGAPLLDIVGGPRTSAETIDLLKRFAASIMQTAIVAKKEKDGYLFNSIIFAMFKTALLLVADGYAEVTDVDRAYMAALSQFAGPFGSMDYVGLDIILATMESQGLRRDLEGCAKAAAVVRPLVERGDLGYKSGKGFYTYPNPAWQQPGFLSGHL
jgi:3-hydroxybutyryl-CoA dehydrogenase